MITADGYNDAEYELTSVMIGFLQHFTGVASFTKQNLPAIRLEVLIVKLIARYRVLRNDEMILRSCPTRSF